VGEGCDRFSFSTIITKHIMKRQNTTHHYETPDALRHDAHTLAEDARALLEATAEITDEKVAEARKRLTEALETGREAYENLRERVVLGAKTADRVVHEHPYPTMAVVFGVGALVGFLLSRRG
jgi:ElaB/YqjD/DUF883 family membrane-anchored ribosome-binding protein